MKYYMSNSSNNEKNSESSLPINNIKSEKSEVQQRDTRQNAQATFVQSMQPKIVLPPGSSPASIGLTDADISIRDNAPSFNVSADGTNSEKSMAGPDTYRDEGHSAFGYRNRLSVDTGDFDADEYNYMNMGVQPQTQNPYMNNFSMPINTYNSGMQTKNYHGMLPNQQYQNYSINDMVRMRPPYMEDMTMTEYLSGRIGEYIKIDLCCGGLQNSKIGVLREIGDDFLVLEEGESGNYIVCGFKGIQLIHVFDDCESE